MNAHAERFNRTLQETFVDYHEELLLDDLAAFNRKLADWLLAYNTVLPHHCLGHNLRYNSCFTSNPSAKGGGPIQIICSSSNNMLFLSPVSKYSTANGGWR